MNHSISDSSPNFHTFLLLALLSSISCSSQNANIQETDIEPVGLLLKEHNNLPALEIGLEVTPAIDADVLVPAFATALSGARSSCSEHAAKLPEVTSVLALSLVIKDSKISISEPKGLNVPFAVCMIKALSGQPLAGLGTGTYTVLMQIRAQRSSIVRSS